MAFDARGWRKLVIGKEVYYWQPNTASDSAELFRVRPEHVPHRLLRVACSWCGAFNWTVGRIEPSIVRDAIEAAAECGWHVTRPKLRLLAFSIPEVPMYCRFAGPKENWLTPTVVALAVSIFIDSAFDRMPILADALEEAGCDNPDILNHCRGACSHVRGCWVVDLVLGKS